MTKNNNGNSLIKKFGIMTLILGIGDSFHLLPRMYALWTTGLEANAAILGIGKLITSITMTIFYFILYYVWRDRYHVVGKGRVTIAIWVLTVIRIVLCLLPQNQWLDYQQPFFWSILRNIPFAIMGIIIIFLFRQEIKKSKDPIFHWMSIAITLSFIFYFLVVLFAPKYPMVGMLMIPKTIAYVWIVCMGWKLFQNQNNNTSLNGTMF